MPDPSIRIEIEGLRELRRSLNAIDGELSKELRDGLAKVSEHVLEQARLLVPRGPTGNARASMKVRKQSAGAAIAVGGSQAPYYPWLDFGGAVGKGKSVKREFIPRGRYLYPTLAAESDEIIRIVDEVVRDVSERAGF